MSETRDTHIVYHCRICGWQSKAMARPWGVRVNKCDNCRGAPLNFVTFQAGREDEEARRLLPHPIEFAEGDGP